MNSPGRRPWPLQLAVVLALAITAGLVWWLAVADDAADSALASGAAPDTRAVRPGASLVPDEGLPPEEIARAAVAAAELGETSPTTTPDGVVLEEPPEKGIDVRVLLGRSTQPVPHAVVCFAEFQPTNEYGIFSKQVSLFRSR